MHQVICTQSLLEPVTISRFKLPALRDVFPWIVLAHAVVPVLDVNMVITVPSIAIAVSGISMGMMVLTIATVPIAVL